MELTKQDNMRLADDHKYSGWGYFENGHFIPHGCGKKFYRDYYVYGNFNNGLVEGPAIESHDMYMQTMQFKHNLGNGWGLSINRGRLSEFGYYKDSKLQVDLSDFALWYFTKMQNAGRDENMLTVYTFNSSHEVAEMLVGYKPGPIQNGVGLVGMGFHFMHDGSIWMGNTASRRFSGKLIHFNSDGTIDCGIFENGELTERMELQEIINAYYGTFDFSEDDLFAGMFGHHEKDPIREQFRNAQPIKVGYNYFSNNISHIDNSSLNKYHMQYTLWEVDFNGTGDFISLGNDDNREEWEIGDSYIITPHGTLEIRDAIFVNEGPLVGVQFDVDGTLKMDEFPCSHGFESDIQVATFALMRQPYNAWIWGYAFDEDGNPVANFCGTDILDGLANFIPFLERKYLKK